MSSFHGKVNQSREGGYGGNDYTQHLSNEYHWLFEYQLEKLMQLLTDVTSSGGRVHHLLCLRPVVLTAHDWIIKTCEKGGP